ncbi:hypothetical protein [Ponticaulis profundi]|uniref:Transposase n=1 Tax=Ponticaulis profundi TaxID=2665222 RepID=A0ABW1S9J6_9PROT
MSAVLHAILGCTPDKEAINVRSLAFQSKIDAIEAAYRIAERRLQLWDYETVARDFCTLVQLTVPLVDFAFHFPKAKSFSEQIRILHRNKTSAIEQLTKAMVNP